MNQNNQTTSQRDERIGVILMIASVLLFTSTALLLSYMNRHHAVDGWVASAYRATLGLIMVYVMQRQTGKLSIQRVFTRPLLFARGLIGGSTIPLYYITIMEIGPGRAGMITGSYPLFAATFAMCFLKEGVELRYYAYMAIALAGLVGIFSDTGIGGGNPLFDSIALMGAIAGGICVVLIRHLRHTETTSNIFAAQCLFTLIIGVAGARESLLIFEPIRMSLLLLASVTVIGGQLCITQAFRSISVAKGSTLQMLTPLLTVIGSALLIGESFGILEIAGGIAIMLASYKIVTSKTG
ncbi:MAG: DMT family transporter [Verrucomicrobiota bacterium]